MNPRHALLAAVVLFSSYTAYQFNRGHRLLEEIKTYAADPNFRLEPFPVSALDEPAIRELNAHCLGNPDPDVRPDRQSDFCRCLATNFVRYVHPKLEPAKRNLEATIKAGGADFAIIGGGLFLVTESCRKTTQP